MSFSRYCRYRATLKRLEGIDDQYICNKLIETLSGFVASQPNTRIMFCKESIDYPDLESHEMLCLHLAPKLKGRPRGRRKKVNQISECSSPPPSSEYSVDSCETNDSDAFSEKRGVSGTPGKVRKLRSIDLLNYLLMDIFKFYRRKPKRKRNFVAINVLHEQKPNQNHQPIKRIKSMKSFFIPHCQQVV